MTVHPSASFPATITRLKTALGERTDAAVAKALGLTAQGFCNRKKIGSLPYEQIVALLVRRGLADRLHWIFTGAEVPLLPPELGKSANAWRFHCELDRPTFEMLRVMAEFRQESPGALARHLLGRAVHGDARALMTYAEQMRALGGGR